MGRFAHGPPHCHFPEGAVSGFTGIRSLAAGIPSTASGRGDETASGMRDASRRDVPPLIGHPSARTTTLDKPGRFIEGMLHCIEGKTWQVPGLWLEIGDRESLEEDEPRFRKFAKS